MAEKNIGKIKSGGTSGHGDITPLMSQYAAIKSAHPDYIVFFRLGDFYEMFGDDAVEASPILGVVLTKRQQTPMCGVPHHSAANYIKTLLAAGKKIALCEQVESSEGPRKLLNRRVVRLITPGTVWEENLLDARRSNYVMAVAAGPDGLAGIAAADISASDAYIAEIPMSELAGEIAALSPGEIIVQESRFDDFKKILTGAALLTSEPDWFFDENRALAKMTAVAGLSTWKSIDPGAHVAARSAMGGLLSYLERIRFPDSGKVVSSAVFRSPSDILRLDSSAIKTLEIVSNMRDGSVEGTLLEVLDDTGTPAGARLLKKTLLSPLTDPSAISRRHECVGFLVEDSFLRRRLREELAGAGDVERILTRLSAASATPREIHHLSVSLKKAARIKKAFDGDSSSKMAPPPPLLAETLSRITSLEDVTSRIDAAIDPDGGDNGFIRAGFDSELDGLSGIAAGARDCILELERSEKSRTGINSLKIGYNSVSGYFIEVTKAHSLSVPSDYIRRQTLTNAERYSVPALVDIEQKILHAAERAEARRKLLLDGIRDFILARKKEISASTQAIALIDVLCSFAQAASAGLWTRPSMNSMDAIDIKNLRHPAVEHRLHAGKFVPNDVLLDGNQNQIILLTGPNMAGKSTYLRQTAIAVVLAQAGSFVPATRAVMGVVDRIFTRIGSADNLAGGESTFMVEMTETASILRGMTPRSLIILDEVGRGTSTFDGISIAWAIVEYLHERAQSPDGKPLGGPKVLFATHYFELTELSEKLPRVKNLSVSVSEWKNEVVFLHKIEHGAADRSYGIHVAKLAGMPSDIIDSSRRILADLETNSHGLLKKKTAAGSSPFQMDFEDFLIFDKLRNIDVESITPVEALNLLADIAGASAAKAEKTEKPQ